LHCALQAVLSVTSDKNKGFHGIMLGWDGGERTKEMMRKGKEKKEND
jgi:hypothetical protein